MAKVSAGIDEAGRGPIIGPLIIASVTLDAEARKTLAKEGIRDSKKLSRKRREECEKIIKDVALEYQLIEISPMEIDFLRKKYSLNAIEAMKASELIAKMKIIPDVVIIDAVDAIAENYTKRIMTYLNSFSNFKAKRGRFPEIICENKADDKYIEVSAASILAKVERDRIISKIKEEYGDFGSGYPSDEKTQRFIKSLLMKGKLPEFVRKSWNTLDRSKQSSLTKFL